MDIHADLADEPLIAPAFIALTQMWWRRREQPLRLGAWYAMNGITNIVGSLLTYGIGHIHSAHLSSYQVGKPRRSFELI